MSGLIQDARYALLVIRREPGFSLFAALIIGLGVGAVTSVFSVMSPLLIRPLPFEEPERLVWIANDGEGGLSSVTSRTSNLRDYRENTQSFEAISGYFAFFGYQSYNLVGEGEPERLVGVGVAGNFLDVLGVKPVLGRNFVDEETVWNGREAAILTHRFWQRRFGGDAAVVGSTIVLNDQPTEVVGVLPEGFDFASTFTPASKIDFLRPFPISDETDRWGNTLAMVGRLAPGATVAGAQAELDTLNQRLEEAEPDRWGLGAVVTGLQEKISSDFRDALWVLAAAALVVLLVACANLSNLLLARSRRRSQEMSVRSACGAARSRLVRQLTFESLFLALGGGVLGALLAVGVTRWVAGTSAFDIPLLSEVSVDFGTLAFTLVATLAAGLAVGLMPALRLSKGDEATTLRAVGRGNTGGRSAAWVRDGLVVAEVALACVLLVGGGLLLRSFVAILDVDLGFEAREAITWRVDTSRDFETLEETRQFYDQLIAEVETVPGVESAGLTDTTPLGRNRGWGIQAQGVDYEDGGSPGAFPRIVDHRYLATMQIPLLAGRTFTADDDGDSQNVVVLNKNAAEVIFPGQDPIGRVALISGDEWQVIGVVGGVRHQSLEQGSGNEMYLPLTQMGDFSTLSMVVRTPLPIESVSGGVRGALRRVDATMPTGDYQSLESIVARAVSPRRFLLLLVGAFAGAALLLAALGIYAVLSYSVAQRTPEIGIRMALGASRGEVRRQVLGQTLVLAGVGIGLGAVVSLATSRFLQSLLHGVGSTDAVTFGGMALVLLAVATVAGFLPARRASRTDPMVALRSVD